MPVLANPAEVFTETTGEHVTPQGSLIYLVDFDFGDGAAYVSVSQMSVEHQLPLRPGRRNITSFQWDRKQNLDDFFAQVEASTGFGFPEETTRFLTGQVIDFLEYVKDGVFLDLNVADTAFDLGVTDSVFDGSNDSEEGDLGGDDDYDPNSCEACGGYNGDDMGGGLYGATGKYLGHVFFEGLTSCDDAPTFGGDPIAVRADILDYLSFYRTRYSSVEAFCVALERIQ